ncbi:exopolyphosphatase / guanosine-5'-triphosphate,3'-diphosphate pyrophosphatase [Cyclonatronum proteinivorum]|uniref:Exopolyphosphatase / guanosine-5'-triphosphate,3'-diphosphate pyrophosphatase n=1 Tax=Cyclonatronum proteinivorum TaxID=1457365 RepID=A0A345UPC4_9BACT|nr:Ppx/GppA phosphatase family protein [Cyclonatronum proteinivorum]AXJ02326.1 exopolyphosphatase / guanosine-5'-triphosphate,3'-diphosphate pyrophosphatase [Cyclonatronum proteinivorum]
MPTKRIAAIDLGTNSFHAVIVDIQSDGRYTPIDSLKEMIRLGRNGVGKKMTKEDMALGLEALRKIKTLCDHRNVERIMAYATSAIREAPNGGDFVQLVIDELGIKIHPIPGYKEAELIGLAVQHGMTLGEKTSLVMDIGGGSTEFVILNQQEIRYMVSRKIGVSRMTSDFVKSDPVKKKEISDMEKHYRKELSMLTGPVESNKPQLLIGSSGTMQNIAAMIAARQNLDVSLTLNEFEYSKSEFEAFYSWFMTLDRKQRLKVTGLDEKRVDFILPGLVLVKFVLEKFGISRVKTSIQAMREGIIIDFIRHEMKALKMLDKYPEPRRRSVHELLKKYRWAKKHSQHVANLALKLFDDLQTWHKLPYRDRELLEYAALMHDIGYYISSRKHHKHTLYIVLNSNLKGFTQDEIEVMAHVARYHRRSVPKQSHELYAALKPAQRQKIKALAGFLRVADGLDRSHYQNVITFETEVKEVVSLLLTTIADPQLEVWGAGRKSELLAELMGRPIEIRAKR